jgi:RNA polymerase subunit RPABC4/transcription elongation factor Spt4
MSARCPSCHASVPAGETICLDCGTELVFTAPSAADAPTPSADPVAEAPPARRDDAPTKAACPDCGEHVQADANGLCPVCGHDFASPVMIDEDAFFRAPPSLDQALAAERERAARFAGTPPPPAATAAAPQASLSPPAATQGATFGAGAARPAAPLPSDRSRQRFAGEPGETLTAGTEQALLFVEGGQSVFFDGRMTQRVRLDVDQLLVGRRDPPAGHYPDIDLAHFRHIDGHISRRHARIYRERGQWRIEDLCDNDATFLNDPSHVLNGESSALTDGDRIMISDSVILTFRLTR